MNQEDSFAPEWDLARIAMDAGRGDGFLADLIELAEDGIGTLVGLMVNGMIVVGVVATSEAMAGALDEQRKQLVDSPEIKKPDDQSDAEWAETMKAFATANSRIVKQVRQEQEEIDASKEGPWDYSAPPRGVARKALELETKHNLTLVNSQVFSPGQVGILRLPVMRVPLDRVAGWWPIPVDEEGRARFKLFSTDGE